MYGGAVFTSAPDLVLVTALSTNMAASESARATGPRCHVRTTADTHGDGLVGRALAGGKLYVEAFVGSGGAGGVYRARHRELGTALAVKVLHASFRGDREFCDRFHAEALAASQLDHLNLTRVHDFGEEPDGLLYIAMEFLDGKNARSALREAGAMPERRAIDIMLQVCAGLGHAHARGVVHRDVKPENLVLVPGTDDDERVIEHVKVCDFGIAQAAVLDPTKAVGGTPAYMSPEQCRGEELDARSDVYACGVVLYELVTGRVPFSGDRAEVLRQHLHVAPPPPSRYQIAIDPRLERTISTALEKDPARRQQSMRELRADLRALLQAAATPSPAPLHAAPSVSVPDWLEDRRAVYASFLGATDPHHEARPVIAPGAFPELIAELVASDARAFATLGDRLEVVLQELTESRDTAALWRLACTVDGIASEGPALPGTRAAVAAAFSTRFSVPALLAPLAEDALVETLDPSGAARKLLVRAGVAGARAAYSARVKDWRPDARRLFVETLNAIGAPAGAVIRAALERIEQRLAAAGAVDIACDLLAAVPARRDDALRDVVARYTRNPQPVLARAATGALQRAGMPLRA